MLRNLLILSVTVIFLTPVLGQIGSYKHRYNIVSPCYKNGSNTNLSKIKKDGKNLNCSCTCSEALKSGENQEAQIYSDGIPLLMLRPTGTDTLTAEDDIRRRVYKRAICLPSKYNEAILARNKIKGDGLKASVAWDANGDKLIVNPYLPPLNDEQKTARASTPPTESDPIKFYEYRDSIFLFALKNRQTLKLRFTEWTIGTVTIPLRYRTTSASWKDRRECKELRADVDNVSAGFGLGLVVAYSYGSTRFKRLSTGNVTRSRKSSMGVALNLEPIKFKAIYEDKGNFEEREVNTVAFSPAIIYMHGIEDIQLSLCIGLGYSFENADDWAHQAQPYFGFGAGFGLFKIGGK